LKSAFFATSHAQVLWLTLIFGFIRSFHPSFPPKDGKLDAAVGRATPTGKKRAIRLQIGIEDESEPSIRPHA